MVIFKTREAAENEIKRIKKSIALNEHKLEVELYTPLIGQWTGFTINMYTLQSNQFLGVY